MTEQTTREYTEVTTTCKELFAKKTADYRASRQILRLPSLIDRIFIKARRIRSIQEKKIRKTEDSIADEFIGIINYCLIAMIQSKLSEAQAAPKELTCAGLEPVYDEAVALTRSLLQNKNHDCGEARRNMLVSSMTDIILMKLLRVKQIEAPHGRPPSEGVTTNYQDIINYSFFCLIKLKENQNHLYTS